jgi:hypothetical protein
MNWLNVSFLSLPPLKRLRVLLADNVIARGWMEDGD